MPPVSFPDAIVTLPYAFIQLGTRKRPKSAPGSPGPDQDKSRFERTDPGSHSAGENLGGNEVISVGSVFAEQVLGQTCCAVIAIRDAPGSAASISARGRATRWPEHVGPFRRKAAVSR
jgi:hypothetical protein